MVRECRGVILRKSRRPRIREEKEDNEQKRRGERFEADVSTDAFKLVKLNFP